MAKSRVQKEKEYQKKYGHIPVDYMERLDWMVDYYKLSPAKMDEIIDKRDRMLSNLFYHDYNVIELLEEPGGASRPKVRILKSNYNKLAMADRQMVHVYVPGAAEDHKHMRRLVDHELQELDQLICTPCDIEYNMYLKTPSYLSVVDTFLCEIGLIRPPFAKPDWDNGGKKYCDMYNHNVWMDDVQVIDGSVHKYYSILPRVEIKLRYLNCVYTRQFYKSIMSRKGMETVDIRYLDSKGDLV